MATGPDEDPDSGAAGHADGRTANDVEREMRPDIDTGERDGNRHPPDDDSRPRSEPHRRHGDDREGDRGVPGHVTKAADVAASLVEVVQHITRAPALHDVLHRPCDEVRAESGNREPDGQAIPAERESQERGDENGDDVARLHDHRGRPVERIGEIVDPTEDVSLCSGDLAVLSGDGGHGQEDEGRDE